MADRPARSYDDETLQRMIETFDYQMQQFHDRVGLADRAAFSELRDSWSKFVDVLFGPIGRTRSCASCRRAQLRTGPRCVYCWHRFEDADAPDPQTP